MFETIGTLAASVFSGGITGIIGVIVQRIFDLKNKKLDIDVAKEKYAHEILLRRLDLDMIEKEFIGRVQVAQVEGEARAEVAESQAFAASFQEPVRFADPSKATPGQAWLLVLLDCLRGLIRPVLTLYLAVLVTLIYWHSKALMNQMPIDPKDAAKLVETIVNTVLYLSTTCTLHYFGTRNKAPGPKLGR
jgi:hypothetical protein